jgi:uncharacterized membrane protein
MSKNKFLQQLNESLKPLSLKEREDILQDYEEHFSIGLQEGKTEEEIVTSLGSPNHIAKELLAGYHVEQATARATAQNVLRATWAVIGLAFFNLVIVLGPAIALAGFILSAWAIGLCFLASPILVLGEAIVHPSGFFLFNFFMSLAFCGLGYFILIGMLFVTRLAIKGFVRYLKYNVSLVKGGLKRVE